MKWHGNETPRQGIRCLLPPDQIFPAAKWNEREDKGAKEKRRNANRRPNGRRFAVILFWCSIALLYLHSHEERVASIGGRRNGELGLTVNRRVKGDVNIVG